MEEHNKNIEGMNEEHFVPKGATAFFILLLVLFAIIWFAIYFLMLGRA